MNRSKIIRGSIALFLAASLLSPTIAVMAEESSNQEETTALEDRIPLPKPIQQVAAESVFDYLKANPTVSYQTTISYDSELGKFSRHLITQQSYKDSKLGKYHTTSKTKADDETLTEDFYYDGEKFYQQINGAPWSSSKYEQRGQLTFLILSKLLIEQEDFSAELIDNNTKYRVEIDELNEEHLNLIPFTFDFPVLLSPETTYQGHLTYGIDRESGMIETATLMIEANDQGIVHKISAEIEPIGSQTAPELDFNVPITEDESEESEEAAEPEALEANENSGEGTDSEEGSSEEEQETDEIEETAEGAEEVEEEGENPTVETDESDRDASSEPVALLSSKEVVDNFFVYNPISLWSTYEQIRTLRLPTSSESTEDPASTEEGDTAERYVDYYNTVNQKVYRVITTPIVDDELGEGSLVIDGQAYSLEEDQVVTSSQPMPNNYAHFVQRFDQLTGEELTKLESDREDVLAYREIFEVASDFEAALGDFDGSGLIQSSEAMYGIDYQISLVTGRLVNVIFWTALPESQSIDEFISLTFQGFNQHTPDLVANNVNDKIWKALSK